MKAISNLLNVNNSEDLFFVAVVAVFCVFMAISVVKAI